MAENDYLSQAAAFFWPQALGLDKANLKLREKIALAQMMQKRAYPKTFGEGLSAIGDAIGDRKLGIELEKLDQDAQADVLKNRAPVDGVSDAPSVHPAPKVPVANNVDLEPAVRPQPTVVVPAPVVNRPLPPDQQQSYESGAPTRMPARPAPTIAQPPPLAQPQTRAVAPPLPPAETAPAPPFGAGSRFDAAFPGQQSAAPPPPGTPVMAEGNEPSAEEMIAGRNSLAQALMQQQAARGGPQPNPTPRAAMPPPAVGGSTEHPAPVIRSAPQAAPIQAMPEQPGAVAGWVPAPVGRAQGVDILGPSPRETALQNFLMSKQNNPYWTQSSPEARELKRLQDNRELRQKELEKDREAQIARDTDQAKQRITLTGDQAERIDKSRKSQLEQQQIRQGLIDGGDSAQPTDSSLLGTPQSPQRDGRPRTPPVPPGQIPKDWAEKHTAELIKDAAGLETAKPELRETLDLMNKIRAHPAKEASLGTLGGLARLTAPGQGFVALHEQLLGKNLASVYQKIKGTGPVGEKEGENLAKAQSALRTAATKEDYDSAMNTLETTLRGAVERMERKMHQPVTAYQKTPDDPFAPDINERRGGFEYIGGDPASPSSWRKIR
jgi:hypothetical protein